MSRWAAAVAPPLTSASSAAATVGPPGSSSRSTISACAAGMCRSSSRTPPMPGVSSGRPTASQAATLARPSPKARTRGSRGPRCSILSRTRHRCSAIPNPWSVDRGSSRGGGSRGFAPDVDPTAPNLRLGGLAYEPAQPDHVYVARQVFPAFFEPPAGGAVAASLDGGETWADLGRQDIGAVSDLALGADDGWLFAATDQGLWRWRLGDGGK